MSDTQGRLDQHATFKGRRSFVIHKQGAVVANYSQDGQYQEVTLELAGINPNKVREKHVAVDMLVGMGIFAIPTLGFLWGAVTARFASEAFCWFLGGFLVFLLPVGLCWREYLRKSYDLVAFTEPLTGNRLVLFRDVPDRAAVDTFVGLLQQAIEKAKAVSPTGGGQGGGMLSDELTRLAALRDRGVLSDAEFQQAKTSLLRDAENRRGIGFHT